MPASNPSPPPDASGTVRGLVSLVAQTFAGVKTFLARAVFQLGITSGAARLDLRSDLGAGASDVCSVAGSTVADASVNNAASLLAVRTGIGGTEADNFRVIKRGIVIGNGASSIFLSTVEGSYILDTGNIRAATLNSTAYLGCSVGGVFRFYADGGNFGRIDQSGTDSTGTPGAATINKPIGKSAIALGAASVVITNSLVSAASHVVITPHARDATCKELIVVPAAGSFTVSGSANATAALPFSWEVKGML